MLDLISAYENYLVNVKQASGNTTVSYLRDIRQFAGWLRDTEEAELVDATQQNIADYLHQLSAQGRSAPPFPALWPSLKNFFCVFGVLRLSAGNAGAACTCRTWREKASPDSNRAGGRAALVSARLRGRKGYRDRAMLEVMYATGLRVSELIGLNVEDVSLDGCFVKCGGKKTRLVPMYPGAVKALSNYMREVRPAWWRPPENRPCL